MHIFFLHDVNGPWVWPFIRLHSSIIISAAFERHNISMHFHGVLLHTKAQFQFQGSWDVALWNPTLGVIPTEIRPFDSPFFAPVWEAVTKRAPACITERVTLSFSRATDSRLFLIQAVSIFLLCCSGSTCTKDSCISFFSISILVLLSPSTL